jgi:hypothetical protein
MRNDFLAKTQAKLLAKDFSTAADTDLIVSGALVRAFDSVNNFDTISSTALSMIGNVGDLNVYLSDLSNRDAFEQILANSQAMNAVAANSTVMTAVAASQVAMTAVAASSTAMSAVAASQVAMSAVAASQVAINAVIASQVAITAINAVDQAVRIWMLAGTNQVYSNFVNVAAVAANSTAMSAVAASSTAMTAVAASSTAMSAVAASSTAINAIWASNIASDAVFSSSVARLAVYGSDTALTALQANPTQVQRQLDTSGRVVSASSSGSTTLTFVPNGTKVILLRRYYGGGEYDYITWGRDKTTDDSAGGVTAPTGRSLYTGTNAQGCTSGTYNSSGSVPTLNDATGNFVTAANGLRRSNWYNGASLYVRYIIV